MAGILTRKAKAFWPLLLLLVSPINTHEAWTKFRDGGFDTAPSFRYRLLPVDPDVLLVGDSVGMVLYVLQKVARISFENAVPIPFRISSRISAAFTSASYFAMSRS